MQLRAEGYTRDEVRRILRVTVGRVRSLEARALARLKSWGADDVQAHP